MKYRKLGKSKLEVSVIGHGCWALGNDYFGEVDEKRAIAAIHASLDAGVNLIDTAPAYGQNFESELTVGKAIAGRRDVVILATKCGVHRIHGGYVRCLDPDIIRCEIEGSLKRLGTDYIDLYQIHWPDYNNGIEGALHELVKLKQEGKIREIGVSNFSTDQMQTGIDIADIVSAQPPLSMLDRGSLENGIIPFCADHNIGVLSYGSLGGGILSGNMKKPEIGGKEHRGAFYGYYDEPMWSKCQELLGVLRGIAEGHSATVAEVSINWALAQRGVSCALVGSSKPETAAANAKAANWELTPDELATIESNYSRILG